MARRIVSTLRTVLGDLPTERAVHFHFDGLNGEPCVCHSPNCTRPAADLR
jgi:hypothetical protein